MKTKIQLRPLARLCAVLFFSGICGGTFVENALADPTAACQHGVRWPNECPKCRAMYGGGSSGGGNYNTGPSQQQIEQQQQQAAQAAAEKKAQEEAEEQARQEAARIAAEKKAAHDAEVKRDFEKRKTEAMREMKGIETSLTDSGGNGGLKGLDDVAVTPGGLKVTSNDSGLKGLDPEPATAAPVVVTDSRVVDARNVPSGVEKSWEEHLNQLSAVPGVGDRLRKGWQAYQVNDFAVAAAWFEDALNHDPNNQRLQDFVRISRSAITAASGNAQKLAVDPVYHAAIDQAVAAHAAGDVAAQKAAAEKMRKAGGVVVLPKDSDLAFLYDLTDNGDEKIIKGDALPVRDEKINRLIKEHPELSPQLSALWKETCTYRIKAENDAMAKSVKELAGTAARLGLPYGHIEETAAKNPKLKAEWEKAIQTVAAAEQSKEIDALLSSIEYFDQRFQKLSRSVEPPKNPYNFYNR